MTGQWDSPVVRQAEVLRKLRDMADKTNATYAKRFRHRTLNGSHRSEALGHRLADLQLRFGIHPRHAPYYIRRVRISATDSLFKMMRDQGRAVLSGGGGSVEEANTFVLEFPVKAPDHSKEARFKDDLTALDQLEYWKKVKLNYTHHNPSATISVSERRMDRRRGLDTEELGYHRRSLLPPARQPRLSSAPVLSNYERGI